MTVARQGDFEELGRQRPFEAEFLRRIPLPGRSPAVTIERVVVNRH